MKFYYKKKLCNNFCKQKEEVIRQIIFCKMLVNFHQIPGGYRITGVRRTLFNSNAITLRRNASMYACAH